MIWDLVVTPIEASRISLQSAWDSVETLPPIEFTAMEAVALLNVLPTPSAKETGRSQSWRERWHGSEPQRGSAIVTDRGDLVVYLGGDKTTHQITTAIVAAHNAALTASD